MIARMTHEQPNETMTHHDVQDQPYEIIDSEASGLSRTHGIRRFILSSRDVAEASEVLSRVFTLQEPITRTFDVSREAFAPVARAVCEGAAATGLSVVARDRENKIIGFRISEPWPAPVTEMPALAPALDHIFTLLGFLEAEFDRIFANDNRAVHFQMMGCMPGYEGLGLGTTMVRDALELARKQGFKRVFVEATHERSANVFRRLEFRTLWQVPYDSYEIDGRRVFAQVAEKACFLMEKTLSPIED